MNENEIVGGLPGQSLTCYDVKVLRLASRRYTASNAHKSLGINRGTYMVRLVRACDHAVADGREDLIPANVNYQGTVRSLLPVLPRV